MRGIVALLLSCLFSIPGRAEPPVPRDQRGMLVAVTPPAKRVVTFNSALWLYLTLEGGTGPIAGASASTVRVVTGGLLGKVFPQAAAIPTTVAADAFFLPNVEAILMLSPDAVLQWAGRNDPAYLDPLDQAGLPVVGLRQNENDADYIATARLLGAVSGRNGRAEALVARYESLYARLDRDVAAVVGETRPKVLYLWKYRPLIPIDGPNFYGSLLHRSGGVNAAQELPKSGAVSMEKILAWDPDVVLLFCCDRTRPAELYADPAWQPVKAVRERRIYKVPAGGSRFGDIVEGPLFSRWLAELLHPTLPARLRGDLRRTFRDIYGYELGEDELDATLHAVANAGSTHYDRFFRRTAP